MEGAKLLFGDKVVKKSRRTDGAEAGDEPHGGKHAGGGDVGLGGHGEAFRAGDDGKLGERVGQVTKIAQEWKGQQPHPAVALGQLHGEGAGEGRGGEPPDAGQDRGARDRVGGGQIPAPQHRGAHKAEDAERADGHKLGERVDCGGAKSKT